MKTIRAVLLIKNQIMKVFCHHIYEYQKGLRNLVLHTLPKTQQCAAEDRLQKLQIDYKIQIVSENKINIFFGAPECVAVIQQFADKPLHEFSPEEDFILGIMLGYSRLQQCQRYLKRSTVNLKIKERA